MKIVETTFANGIHPLEISGRPYVQKRVYKARKSRADMTHYKIITQNDVTLYIRDFPCCTSGDIARMLGASKSNVCHVLKSLSVGKIINRNRESNNEVWKYTANAIAPINVNYADMIRQFLAVNPGSTSPQILEKIGVPNIFSKIKRLVKRGEITFVTKMTANYWRPLNHYSLAD